MLDAVCIGDLHLDGLNTLFPASGLDLQLEALHKTLDYAASKGVGHVIYLGDVADNVSLSEDSRVAFLTVLEHYRKYLKQYVILGNHDISTEDTHSLKSLKFVSDRYMETVSIFAQPTRQVIGGIPVNFLPFPHRQPLGPEQAVNIAHVDRVGAVRDNGYRITKGEGLDDEHQYWVIGHLHTPQQVGKRTFFPGTLYQMDFGETLPKGFAHIQSKMSRSGKLLFKYDWVEQRPPYTLTNIAVDSIDDLKQVGSCKQDLYKLFISAGVALPPNFMAQHPNVVQTIGYRDQKELKQLLSPQEGVDNTEDHFRLFCEKVGAAPALQRRASRLLDKLHKKHGAVDVDVDA